MMHAKLFALEENLERFKRLIDASVMIDVIVSLLISKGITTEDEIALATAKMKSSDKYEFEVHEAERDCKVFSLMMRKGVEAEIKESGLSDKGGEIERIVRDRK